ncbi:hypothetical protein EJ04DRAFT_590042 [Polyplosphaeria fusca]|uniref:Uncharacterized protein n=1 Tax=Polyplosphaeria fusca TaxID=682080 RepID=A0A9P4QPA7_9PLEO|nr:hypothetical protein EJ04DRAFT_590042 [Polyplosphaeria fusca]
MVEQVLIQPASSQLPYLQALNAVKQIMTAENQAQYNAALEVLEGANKQIMKANLSAGLNKYDFTCPMNFISESIKKGPDSDDWYGLMYYLYLLGVDGFDGKGTWDRLGDTKLAEVRRDILMGEKDANYQQDVNNLREHARTLPSNDPNPDIPIRSQGSQRTGMGTPGQNTRVPGHARVIAKDYVIY